MSVQFVLFTFQLLVSASGFALLYFKTYTAEKAKNQATKEDIGAITKIVENIKTELGESIELYKSNLSYKSEHYASLRSYEREAIFNLDEKMAFLISYLMSMELSSLEIERYDEIEITNLEYEKAYFNYNEADNKLDFFVENEEYHNLKIEFLKSVFEIKKLYNAKTVKLINLLISKNKEIKAVGSNAFEISNNLITERLNFNNSWQDERLALYVNLRKSQEDLRDYFKKRLKALLNPNP
jgi:hypothetical protein